MIWPRVKRWLLGSILMVLLLLLLYNIILTFFLMKNDFSWKEQEFQNYRFPIRIIGWDSIFPYSNQKIMSKLDIRLSFYFLIKILKMICVFVCVCVWGRAIYRFVCKVLTHCVCLGKYQFLGKFSSPFFFSVSLHKPIASNMNLCLLCWEDDYGRNCRLYIDYMNMMGKIFYKRVFFFFFFFFTRGFSMPYQALLSVTIPFNYL